MSLDLCPDRFWQITPRLWLVEVDAAQLRQRRNEDMMLTAAWVSAGLQRAKRFPKLNKLLARPGEQKSDLRMYLEGVKRCLPSLTPDQWRASKIRRDPGVELP